MEYGRVVIVEDLLTTSLGKSRPIIYDQEIGLQLLHREPATGAEHYLIRYPAGLVARPHRHTAAHTLVVLEGRLEVNGQVIGPGSYAHFPAGESMHHAPSGEHSCQFVAIFDGPFDVDPLRPDD